MDKATSTGTPYEHRQAEFVPRCAVPRPCWWTKGLRPRLDGVAATQPAQLRHDVPDVADQWVSPPNPTARVRSWVDKGEGRPRSTPPYANDTVGAWVEGKQDFLGGAVRSIGIFRISEARRRASRYVEWRVQKPWSGRRRGWSQRQATRHDPRTLCPGLSNDARGRDDRCAHPVSYGRPGERRRGTGGFWRSSQCLPTRTRRGSSSPPCEPAQSTSACRA